MQRGTVSGGNMVYSDREVWGAPTEMGTIMTRVFLPGNSGLSKLDAFATTFECWRLRSAKVHYVPTSGTQSVGSQTLALDYDPTDLPTTLAGVMAMNPVAKGPVWSPICMDVSPARCNKAKWMYCFGTSTHPGLDAGFALAAWNTGQANNGEFWIDYTVEFTNPRGSQAVAALATRVVSTANIIVQPDVEQQAGPTYTP